MSDVTTIEACGPQQQQPGEISSELPVISTQEPPWREQDMVLHAPLDLSAMLELAGSFHHPVMNSNQVPSGSLLHGNHVLNLDPLPKGITLDQFRQEYKLLNLLKDQMKQANLNQVFDRRCTGDSIM